jgi:hypothetical protein
MRFGQLKLRNPEFQQLKNKYAKYIFCFAFVIITQWVSIFNNLKNIKIILFYFIGSTFYVKH